MPLTSSAAISVALLIATSSQKPDPWRDIGPLFTPPDQYRNDLGNYVTVLKFKDGGRVRTGGEGKKRRKEILKEWTGLLVPWPPLAQRLAITYLQKERVEGFTRHKIEIEIAPGRTASAYLLIPDKEGRHPAVLDV